MQKYSFAFVCLLTAILMLSVGTGVYAQDETLTNAEIISLHNAGLSDAVIVSKIRGSKANFDLSTNSLIELKKAGVSDDIVGAMLEAKTGKSATAPTNGGNNGSAAVAASSDPNNPSLPHGYGIYLYEEKDGVRKMTQLTPNVSGQNRVGGIFSSAMTYGISKMKVKASLPGNTAALQLKTAQPIFYFYLDTNTGGMNTASGIPSTTNEFALIKFSLRGDSREVTIAKASILGAKSGTSDEYVIPFTAQTVSNGVFKVTPNNALKNGEYGFYLINSGNSNANGGVGSKFFDFGIKLTP